LEDARPSTSFAPQRLWLQRQLDPIHYLNLSKSNKKQKLTFIGRPLRIIDILKLFWERLFKILKSEHHDRDVVECLVGHRGLHHLLYHVSAYLVNWLIFLSEIFFSRNKTLFNNLGVTYLIENSVTSEKKKIHFIINCEFFDIRHSNYDIRISSKLLSFSLDISKCPGDWKPSWEYSEWTINDVRIFILISLLENSRVILTGLVSDCLHLLELVTSGNCLSLVYSATVRQNTLLFDVVIGLVVKR
jgi:hypothetical protein